MISPKDATGLYTFNHRITQAFPPKAIAATLPLSLCPFEPETDDKTDILTPLHQIAELIRKRSLVIIISDLLDERSASWKP
jgi:hypothetical protein